MCPVSTLDRCILGCVVDLKCTIQNCAVATRQMGTRVPWNISSDGLLPTRRTVMQNELYPKSKQFRALWIVSSNIQWKPIDISRLQRSFPDNPNRVRAPNNKELQTTHKHGKIIENETGKNDRFVFGPPECRH